MSTSPRTRLQFKRAGLHLGNIPRIIKEPRSQYISEDEESQLDWSYSEIFDSVDTDSTFDSSFDSDTGDVTVLATSLADGLHIFEHLRQVNLCLEHAAFLLDKDSIKCFGHVNLVSCSCQFCKLLTSKQFCQTCNMQQATSTPKAPQDRAISPMDDAFPPPPDFQGDDHPGQDDDSTQHVGAGARPKQNLQRVGDTIAIHVDMFKTLLNDVNALKDNLVLYKGEKSVVQDQYAKLLNDLNMKLGKAMEGNDFLNKSIADLNSKFNKMLDTDEDKHKPVYLPGSNNDGSGKSDAISNTISHIRPRYKINEPESFEATDDIDLNAWIKRVDHFTNVVGLKDEAKAQYIVTLLKGTPFEKYNAMPPEQQKDPSKIIDMLKTNFGTDGRISLYYNKLFSLQKGGSQSLEDYYKKLTHYLSLLNITDVHSRIWHFTKGLPMKVRNQLEITRARSLEDAYDLAQILCNKEDEAPNVDRAPTDNTAQKIAELAQRIDQLSNNYSNVNAVEGDQRVCWGCHSPGHVWRTCPYGYNWQGRGGYRGPGGRGNRPQRFPGPMNAPNFNPPGPYGPQFRPPGFENANFRPQFQGGRGQNQVSGNLN